MGKDGRARLWWSLPLVTAAICGGLLWNDANGDPFVSYSNREIRGVKNVHAFRGRPLCQACHPSLDARLARESVRLCAECHPNDHGHPMDVVQPVGTAGGLPLGPGGEMLCHTCHDPHDVSTNVHGLREPSDAVCLKCHEGH